MSKLLNLLSLGQCDRCGRDTLVRERPLPGEPRLAQVCVRCVPVDGRDMTHDSHQLAATAS